MALFLLAAPRSMSDSIASKLQHCLELAPDSPPDAGDPDYYVVQSLLAKEQKYHIASPAYQQFVGAMKAQKTVPPWDADGNIPFPGSSF